jgi:pimeloyl-ACP methyl ester carboxylesterase
MVRRFYVDTAKGQIHGRIASRPDKPWLVCLHQSPSSSVMFEALIPFLSPHFSVLAPDNPGFGQSDPISPLSVASLGACVVDVMKAHDIDQAFVFGHHTGAAIAAYLGASQPQLCAAIAMCGPPALTQDQRQMLPSMAPVVEAEASGAHLTSMWAKLRAKETSAPPALSTRELTLAFSAQATREAYQAVADFDFLAALSHIACPLLLFAGERDSLIDYLPAARNAAPNAKIIRIEDAGGYICDLRPDLVATLLVDGFLGEK